jgi:hypothetical protein
MRVDQVSEDNARTLPNYLLQLMKYQEGHLRLSLLAASQRMNCTS